MRTAIELARKISKEVGKNWLEEIKEHGLFKTFEPIYKLPNSTEVLNTLVCAIIYSYDPQSKMIDLNADGFSINKNILNNLGAEMELPIYKEFCELKNEDINDAIGGYLDMIKDWRFVTARKMIDFHSRTMSQEEPNMKEVDEEKKPKVLENISRALREGVSQRQAADNLVKEMNTDYVSTSHRTKEDFGVDYVQNTLDMMGEENKKIDIFSWRDFITHTYPKLKAKST